MADHDYMPFTIVKEMEIDKQSSDENKQYQWNLSATKDKLKINISNLTLKPDPQETLNMQVDIAKSKIKNTLLSASNMIEICAEDRYTYHQAYCYNYKLNLEFPNYLHEFSQNYSYEITCKLPLAGQQESKYLFGCIKPRLKESLSFEGRFVVEDNNWIQTSKSNLYFYIRRLNNDSSVMIDDEKSHKVMSTLRNTCYDVVLDAKDGRLTAHKAILSQNSDVFQAMFSVEMKESHSGIINMLEFEARVVKKMLDYLYTRQLGELGDMTNSLFKLAHRYQLHDLCRRCEEYYIFNVKIDNDNIVEVLKLSDVYELEKLNECAMNFANRHEKELIRLASYCEYLIQSVNLDNAVAILLLAEKYGAADVKMKIFDFIKDNYPQMMKDEHFLELFELKSRLMKEIHIYIYT